jgi:hypothetical protein
LYLFLLEPSFFAGLVSAENISITYPSTVSYSNIFQINLNLIDFSGVFDIKVDIFNSTDTLCNVLNGVTWQSCYNYINSLINTSINNSTILNLNITKFYYGISNITIKVRNSSGSNYKTFSGYLLNINYTQPTSNNQTTNQTNSTNLTSDTSDNDEIYLELDWDDSEIINEKEFEIEVSVFNLENYEYDIKIWIEEDGEVISERYDENSDDWKSGYYYLESFFEGTGNKKKDILLRLNEEHINFSGKTKIYAKLRKGSSNIADYEKTIKVLESNLQEQENQEEVSESKSPVTLEQTSVIRLNKQPIEETSKNENSIIYKSKNEYIKEYAGYAFAFICVIMIIVLLIKGV